jgi:hypothetical protein
MHVLVVQRMGGVDEDLKQDVVRQRRQVGLLAVGEDVYNYRLGCCRVLGLVSYVWRDAPTLFLLQRGTQSAPPRANRPRRAIPRLLARRRSS